LVGGGGICGNGPCAAVDEESGVVRGRGGHGDYGRALHPGGKSCQGGAQYGVTLSC
jgi:hypothetical protein